MSVLQNFLKTLFFNGLIHKIAFWLGILTIILLIFDFGFPHSTETTWVLFRLYLLTLFCGILSETNRFIGKKEHTKFGVLIFDVLSIIFLTILLIAQFGFFEGISFLGFYVNSAWVYTAIILIFLREVFSLKLDLKRSYINPAQLFILSFLSIILIGTFLLMLPNSTYQGISFIDALFTATSAVCVTGLIVVDTGSYFTPLGQTIILSLIQIGGLGIMTFASYFSYFFRGNTTYENQIILRDMTNAEKLGEVFSTLKKIILVTFSIEAVGCLIIYYSLDKNVLPGTSDRLFFSIFHAVSAFCNAGFSTLSSSLYQIEFRFNYLLHLTIAGLFIIGGLGFPIVFNLLKYLKYLFAKRLFRIGKKSNLHIPWIINLNTRIVIITSLILTITGTLLFFVLEYNNTLAEHNGFGKIVTAFFGATTPRTAGFNSVDTASLSFPTLMIIFLLMWIGASPASTGGGIKTSTFAIALLNCLNVAKGKTRLEIYRRQIADVSIRRAFAIMFLSLLIIGLAVFLISAFDSEKELLSIAFECFSAYSTVGLSVGITSSLSEPSKLVIIFVMFIGRVSMLSILIALVKKSEQRNYRYPTEEILIN